MTREELLESHIYCPEVIDDRIEAYLKLGFDVLLSTDSALAFLEHQILFRMNPRGKDQIPEFKLKMCDDFENLQTLFEYPKLRLFRMDFMPIPCWCITPDDVDILIEKLKYENARKTETTVQDIF
jgi:hypothetical protein